MSFCGAYLSEKTLLRLTLMAGFDSSSTAESVAKALADEIKGKTVIVTGVTKDGYGAEVARVLALVGARVILAGRSLDKLKETAETIKKEIPHADLHELVLDLGSQQTVREAANEVLKYPEPIDALILNAAVMATAFQKSPEGIESQFAINHINNFLFTNLIVPKLLEAPNPRVVAISSSTHSRGSIRFDDYNFQDGKVYDRWVAYEQSKIANILFIVELANRYSDTNLRAFSVVPGNAITGLQRHLTSDDYTKMSHAFNPDGTAKGDVWGTVGQGTATHIVAAFDPTIADKSGSCLVSCQVTTNPDKVAPHALDKETAKKLWELSERLVGQKFGAQP